MKSIDRRSFLGSASAAVKLVAISGTSLSANFLMASGAALKAHNTFCAFTKPLQSLSFDELAAAIARIGYDGVEIGIRRNGHVAPDQVEEQLPRLVDSLHKQNLELAIMASDITSMKEPNTARVLRAAAQAGIRTYRLGYFSYDLSRPIAEQLTLFKSSLRDVIAASNDLGLVPVYQNHSGSGLMGAPLWDLHELIETYKPDQVGVALDVGHMMVEGGLSWPIQYHLMRPHLRAVYVKDFVWKGHDVEWVPLGEGRVEPKVFNWLHESGFRGPISLHVEYLEGLEGAQRVTRNVQAFERDLVTLRRLMAA
jgi:sugar phosphate isomerase/epimerase